MLGLFKSAPIDGNTSSLSAQQLDTLNQQAMVVEGLKQNKAYIQFTPDGMIQDANDHFLNAMGYSLSQIKGEHHKIFCESNYTNSTEYADFWRDLKSGKAFNGRFKRITASGQPIWIEATYCPVSDDYGQVCSVVKFASDVTEQVKADHEHEQIANALNCSSAVIEFDLKGHILHANENFLLATGYALEEIVGKHHRIFCPDHISSSASYKQFWDNLASGGFTSGLFERIDSQGKPLWLEASYNPISDINNQPYKVIKFARNITERVQGEKDAIEAVYTTSVETEQVSSQAKESLDRMVTLMRQMSEDVSQASEDVTSLNAASERINSIVDTILSIAEQTNLLALNAAIEAARAGEQGRGFAVVADEVRNLAKRTSDSIAEVTDVVEQNRSLSKKVTTSIQNTEGKTGEAEELIENVSRVLNEVTQAVQSVVESVAKRSEV